MRSLPVCLTLVLIGVATRGSAQAASDSSKAIAPTSTILRMPGKTIEILGLNRWTPAMIQDSMNVYAPGESLTSHACAAILRYKLHFAEAASIQWATPGDSTTYVIVPLVEPQDSALVAHRTMPLDTLVSKAPWPLLAKLAGKPGSILNAAVGIRLYARGKGEAPALPKWVTSADDSAAFRDVWALLDKHSAPRDAAVARKLLHDAPNVNDRVAAISVLSSFGADDATWWALAATLREQEGDPRYLAGGLLAAFADIAPRPVDWKPAARDLHAVLNGANLWTMTSLFQALVKTGVGPKLARPLLADGGHAVLMYAGAARSELRNPALELLRAVSGKDFGADVGAWRQWMATL